MENIYIDKLDSSVDKKALLEPLLKKDSFEIEFVYGSDFSNTKMLRDFIEYISSNLWFDSITRSRLVLITDELNNNAIEYWSDPSGINKLRIIFKSINWETFLNLEVEDNGRWKAPKSALDMETLRAHRLKLWYFNHDSIRGRGLFLIIVKLVDRLYFRNSSDWWLIVWIKMKKT